MDLFSRLRVCARYTALSPGRSWRICGRKYSTLHVRPRPLPCDTRTTRNSASTHSLYDLSGAMGGWPAYREHQSLLEHTSSSVRHYASSSGSGSSSSDKKPADETTVTGQPEEVKAKDVSKMTYWERFKQMYKEYWYVLIPVHCLTSAVWYGSFYYVAKSGVDIVPLLQQLGAGEALLKPLRDTGAGFFAVAYAMYKLATPARYTVTLGGTTLAINYLRRWGVIKPMPSSERMKAIIQEKGRELRSRRARVLAKMNLKRQGGGGAGSEAPTTKKGPDD